ncbi:MAG: secretion protein HlyD [Isosphaeraceae bacterium]
MTNPTLQPRDAPRAEPPPRPRRRILPRIVVLVLIAGAAGGGAWYLYEHRPRDDGRLVLQGNVDVRQVNLAFKVEGRIETLGVDEGDAVKPGQVLATLDKRYFDDELRLARARRDNQKAALDRLEHGSRPEEIAEARASLAEQQAAMENARLVLQRREALMQKGSVTREEYDNARTSFKEAEARTHTAEEAYRLAEIGPRQEDIEAARAQLRAEEASVSQAERRLADSELIAPGAGEILTRARERGAIVSPGETVFTLTLSSPVWVRTYVNETDLGRVEPDMPAYVRTDSAPDKVYRGHVGFISPTAEFTPKSVETRELRTDLVYRLRIVVDNPDGGLRQGMPVTIRFDPASGGDRAK